jgi:hypothetical protein
MSISEDRNDQIIKALEELAQVGKKVVRWTDIKKKTDFSAQKVTSGLKSLQKYGEVLAEEISTKRKLYALSRFKKELIEKASSTRFRASRLEKLMNEVLNQLKNEEFERITLEQLAKKLAASPSEMESIAYQLAPNYGLTISWKSRKKGLWNNIQFHLEQAGGVVEKFPVKRVLHWEKRDSTTGRHLPTYQEKKDVINGILILKGATELISVASKLGIHLKRKYEETLLKYGIFLTADKLCFKDMMWQNDSLFFVEDVEKRLDGTKLEFYIVHACEVYVEH